MEHIRMYRSREDFAGMKLSAMVIAETKTVTGRKPAGL